MPTLTHAADEGDLVSEFSSSGRCAVTCEHPSGGSTLMEASGVEGRKSLRLVFRDQSLLQPSPMQTSSAANAARPLQPVDVRACSTRYQKGQAKATTGYSPGTSCLALTSRSCCDCLSCWYEEGMSIDQQAHAPLPSRSSLHLPTLALTKCLLHGAVLPN